MRIGSLFAGVGGFEKGLEESIEGAKTIWQVEQDLFCQMVLKKHWPVSELFDDVTTVGKHNLKPVDLICGGFPCQDISVAGTGAGIHEGKKSNLWFEMFRIIRELCPRYICIENVSVLRLRGLDEICGTLAGIGYDAEWQTIQASNHAGAPHRRSRIFIVAYPMRGGALQQSERFFRRKSETVSPRYGKRRGKTYWDINQAPPLVCRVDDGIPNWLDRHRALGNAIVPQVSAVIGTYINNHWRMNEKS